MSEIFPSDPGPGADDAARLVEREPCGLGATRDGNGVHFALYSAHATAVELCLFEHAAAEAESRRVELERTADDVWRVEVAGLGPGALYGYRVHGPYAPSRGHRFDPSKLLVDPYARAITGEPRASRSLHSREEPEGSPDGEDSAAAMPRCVVCDPGFDWAGDRPPRTAWSDTVIYECHVRGMTQLHPELDEALRGTYLGLAEPPVLEHLLGLGVTAVELLPVHQIASEPHLLERGLNNYWGYSTLGYFAPHSGYARGRLGEQVDEFKTMVRELHRAGLEVILDVVYNHTAEGDHLGPTLSLRGIDNRSYYRLEEGDPGRYANLSGCGNTLDIRKPPVLKLVLDSLRYWVEEMHVDGFRFDLAPILGRQGDDGVSTRAQLFESIAADPVLSRVKLIAEPWELDARKKQLGRFPSPWAEWNDLYRDAVRRFWRGDGWVPEVATRLAGSRDLFSGRESFASINFVTSHDGFTLADLVSYEQKSNLANGEGNRDGHNDNLGRNWGVEGPTNDPAILAARRRAQRNFLATLAFSRGVPMLLYGDEVGRTQRGNNNAYCQDNELTWLDWSKLSQAETAELFDSIRRALALRRELPALRTGGADGGSAPVWLDPGGRRRSLDAWPEPEYRAFAMHLPAGESGGELLLANATPSMVVFRLPAAGGGREWHQLFHTADTESSARSYRDELELDAFALALLAAR